MYRSSAHQQIDFETLYRMYWPRIVRFCATCLAACPDGTAEEVAQDVFLAAHRALAEQRYRGDGSLSTFTAPAAAEREGYGFDGSFHWGPFDLIGEYLSERYEPRVTGRFRAFRAEGYYIQGSYFIVARKLQVVTKYEHFNPAQLSNDNLDSITGGINYFIHSDDIKLMANYIHTWSNFRESRPALGDADFDEILLRIQIIF